MRDGTGAVEALYCFGYAVPLRVHGRCAEATAKLGIDSQTNAGEAPTPQAVAALVPSEASA
jgi:hypothetical protein